MFPVGAGRRGGRGRERRSAARRGANPPPLGCEGLTQRSQGDTHECEHTHIIYSLSAVFADPNLPGEMGCHEPPPSHREEQGGFGGTPSRPSPNETPHPVIPSPIHILLTAKADFLEHPWILRVTNCLWGSNRHHVNASATKRPQAPPRSRLKRTFSQQMAHR